MKWNKELVEKAIYLLKVENKSRIEISKILGCSKRALDCIYNKNNIKNNKVERVIRKCLICDKPIRPKYKFCSHSCRAKYCNPLRKTIYFCLCCNKQLKNSERKYCSNECQYKYLNDIKLNQWLNGEILGHCAGGHYSLLDFVRKYVFDRAGYKCEECGCNIINKHTNKTILQIDHIDGNAANATPSNLKVLCPNCHAQTATFGFINKRTSARYSRKQYRNKIS